MAAPKQLKPFTNDNAKEMGARGGKAKTGSKHLSTIIREIAGDIDWSKTTLKNRDQMQVLYGRNGWKAIVYVAMTKAMAGDTQAMKWLAENAFGKNIDITTNGKELPTPIMKVDNGILRDDSNPEN